MNPLIPTLELLLENDKIPYSKWPKSEISFLDRQVMLDSIYIEQLPNGRRISIANVDLLLKEIITKFPNFGSKMESQTRHEAVMAVRDAHQSVITYPTLAIRRIGPSGIIEFAGEQIELIRGSISYLSIIERELPVWLISGRVVLIENLEPFLYAQIVHTDYDFAIYYGGTLSENALGWLSNQKVELLMAPDYDPVGLSQFEKLRKTAESTLWIPSDIGEKFEKYHKKETLHLSNNRSILSKLLESDNLDTNTSRIIELIENHQGGLDQEVFYPVEICSQN